MTLRKRKELTRAEWGFLVAPAVSAFLICVAYLVVGQNEGENFSNPLAWPLLIFAYYAISTLVVLAIALPSFSVLKRFNRVNGWSVRLGGLLIGSGLAILVFQTSPLGWTVRHVLWVGYFGVVVILSATVFWWIWCWGLAHPGPAGSTVARRVPPTPSPDDLLRSIEVQLAVPLIAFAALMLFMIGMDPRSIGMMPCGLGILFACCVSIRSTVRAIRLWRRDPARRSWSFALGMIGGAIPGSCLVVFLGTVVIRQLIHDWGP